MSDFWSLALSWGKVFANWYWGGLDGLLSSLVVFVVMAHITDGMCMIVDHRPLSRAWIQDIFKTILIFILVGVGNILDTNILTSTPALRMTIILYYLSVEGLIILEDAAHMGLPVPERLREVLEQMRQNRINTNKYLKTLPSNFCRNMSKSLSPNCPIRTYIIHRGKL